jgi:hypothetical protein
MARASSSSIAHSSPSSQVRLNRQMRRWLAATLRQLRPVLDAGAARCAAERYRKHFHCFSHASLLLFHGLTHGQSLRESYAAFAACPGLVLLSGLAVTAEADDERVGVSFSQFADSNTTRPAAFLAALLPVLVAQVRSRGTLEVSHLPPNLHVLDSTFLRLSLLLAPWAPSTGASDVPGVRVQVGYAPALDLPEHILVTDSHHNDCQGFDLLLLDNPTALAALRDQTLVFDLGYYSHRRFARLLTARVHFVTRLQAQATVHIEADLPVQSFLCGLPAGRVTVLSDQRMTLGSEQNRTGAVLPGLRLVTARVEPQPKAARRGATSIVYQLVTDRCDLDAADVVQLYLWRWQVELFFRWLKSHVHLPRLLGYTRNAVELTVYLAIVVHLLTILAAHDLGLSRRSPALLRRLLLVLAQLTPDDGRDTSPSAHQLAFPGWENESPVPP